MAHSPPPRRPPRAVRAARRRRSRWRPRRARAPGRRSRRVAIRGRRRRGSWRVSPERRASVTSDDRPPRRSRASGRPRSRARRRRARRSWPTPCPRARSRSRSGATASGPPRRATRPRRDRRHPAPEEHGRRAVGGEEAVAGLDEPPTGTRERPGRQQHAAAEPPAEQVAGVVAGDRRRRRERDHDRDVHPTLGREHGGRHERRLGRDRDAHRLERDGGRNRDVSGVACDVEEAHRVCRRRSAGGLTRRLDEGRGGAPAGSPSGARSPACTARGALGAGRANPARDGRARLRRRARRAERGRARGACTAPC